MRVARRGDGRVDHQPGVHHRVDLRRLDDTAQQRVLGPDADELGALELPRRILGVDPDDRLDHVALLECLRQATAPVGGEPRYENAPGLHQPNHTDVRFWTMSQTFSWMRARTSCATVCTSDLSSYIPSWSNSIGSRNRILNLAGRYGAAKASGPSAGNVGVIGK